MHSVDHFLSSVGVLVRTARSDSMDQEELAQRVGLGRSTISSIENGKGCKMESLCLVFEYLGLLDDFQVVVDEHLSAAPTKRQRKARGNLDDELNNDF